LIEKKEGIVKMEENSASNSWKEKAKDRRLENKFLKQRVKELSLSRDNWKHKALNRGVELEAIEQELKELKKKFDRSSIISSEEKVNGYVYDLVVIQMLVCIKLKTSASFRAIGKIMVIMVMYINSFTKTPHHTSVAIWVQKIGYYELTRPKASSDDWILILDESIQIGTEKLLVILGIRIAEIDFNRPLTYQDLTPLKAISKSRWNSELIADQLNELKATLGTIVYAVGDYGSYIKKGLQSAQIAHLYDITHKIASILKKIYRKDERFQSFTQEMAKMRTNCFQTAYAYLIPPRQRQKSRYQNVGIISNWGMNILHYLQKHPADQAIADKLSWVVEYQGYSVLKIFDTSFCD
jgi:hypothetical protein